MSNTLSKIAPDPNGPRQDEYEVFRISPVPGKYYSTAEYTREIGSYFAGMRYFTTHEPRYVGLFIQTMRTGYGDGGQVFSYFDRDGERVTVEYTYAGTTSFVEVDPPFAPVLK